MIVIADSGPIIHLSHLRLLDLLPAIYGRILVPEAVYDEVVHRGAGLPGSAELAAASWCEVVSHDNQDALFRILRGSLHLGESAALSIAMAHHADLVLMDDAPARQAAKHLGLKVKGTLGILVRAKQHGRVNALAPLIDELLHNDVWLDEALIRQVLREVGEEP